MLTVKFAFWLVIAADTRKEIQKTIKTKKKNQPIYYLFINVTC